MTTAEILAKATPRPWAAIGHQAIYSANDAWVTTARLATTDQRLIVLAVNSYEPRETLLRQLVEALELVSVGACAVAHHEKKDRHIGSECPIEERIRAALAAARKELP